jgi:hypothetical protein
MAAATFWALIDAARGTTDPTKPSATPKALSKQLDALSGEKVAAFEMRYADIMTELDRWDVWGAGYAAARGMGDDEFDYFRAWLIGKGPIVVAKAESDPDDLAQYFTSIDSSKDDFDNESLDYVADDILTKRYGQASADKFESKIGAAVDDDPAGKEFDETTIDTEYPKLTAWAKTHGN